MPYKDKNKAREASRERMRRYRAKGVTSKGVTKQGVTRVAMRRHLQYPAFEGPVLEPEPQSHNPMMVGYVPPQEGE